MSLSSKLDLRATELSSLNEDLVLGYFPIDVISAPAIGSILGTNLSTLTNFSSQNYMLRLAAAAFQPRSLYVNIIQLMHCT
jgi:hypothetical protein